MMKSWKQALLVSLLSVAFNSVAQVSVRPDVLSELQLLQKMVVAKKFSDAFAKTDSLREKANLNIEERKHLENINQNASLVSEKFERAIVSLEYLYEAKNISNDDKVPYVERLVYANQQLKNSAEVAKWSKIYLAQKGSNPAIRKLFLQTVAEVTQPETVIEESNFLQRNLGFKLTEAELQLLAVAQYKLKNEDGYFNTLAELIGNFPKDEYWQNLISQLTSKSNVTNKVLLEWYRVYAVSGAMKDPDDWLFYAETALKVGLPHESVEVLNALKSKSLKLAPEQVKNSNLLEKRVVAAALEDDKVFKKMSQSPLNDLEVVQLADLNLAKKNWSVAIDLYKKAAEKADEKQRSWINFHLGVAYFNSGDTENASKLFIVNTSDQQLSRLNRMWSVLAKR